MIEVTTEGVRLGVWVAKALLACAHSDEKNHPRLCAVGIDGSDLCATNGHLAARFETKEAQRQLSRPYHDRAWRRQLVQEKLDAAGRSGEIVLGWSELDLHLRFWPVGRVEPNDGVDLDTSREVKLDVSYLALLEPLAKGCVTPPKPGESWNLPGALLVSLKDNSMPVRWEIAGPTQRCWLSMMGQHHSESRAVLTRAQASRVSVARRATKRRTRAVAP